jgi:hypothetical protein
MYGKDEEGNDYDLFQGTILAFARNDRGKLRNISVGIAYDAAEVVLVI